MSLPQASILVTLSVLFVELIACDDTSLVFLRLGGHVEEELLTHYSDGETPAGHFGTFVHEDFSVQFPESGQVHFLYI